MDKLLKFWDALSHYGAENAGYSEARRIILSNQVAFLATVTPQLYNLAYVIYDYRLLLPPILVNIAGSLICLSVLFLNQRGHTRLTKYIITIVPNLHIFLLTYYVGTATGMHLLYIMLVSFVLFLMSSERKIVIWPVSALPVVLFFISYVKFTPQYVPIQLSAGMNQFLYVSHALTVFLLTMLFFGLFFQVMLVAERLLENEYRRSENLLLSILPDEVAQRLKQYPESIADTYPSVTILFADIVGFTSIASAVTPDKLVAVLNSIFSRFDQLVDKYQLEKIKTIGDAYMVAGGIPAPMDNHTEVVARLAIDMLNAIPEFDLDGRKLDVRIGFHTGPVVAGVIGTKKYSYDIWGDAVNLASRLESHGLGGKIHVSREVFHILKDRFAFESRGLIPIKGMGSLETYFMISGNGLD